MPYARYVAVLKWLTLALFAYFGTLMTIQIPWGEAAAGFLIPTFSSEPAFWTTIVAILGTTISPYLFFCRLTGSRRYEREIAAPTAGEAPWQGADAIGRIRADTYVGMAFSNLIALAIMVTTAATLHAAGVLDVESSAQAAEALKPVAGEAAFVIFALGIIGTGLLAVPVLAGSAAYALGEAFRWPIGLARQPLQAKAFYTTIALATALGFAMKFAEINPIKALYWSAVLNGMVSVPVMAAMMLISSNRKIMGKFTVGPVMRAVGWLQPPLWRRRSEAWDWSPSDNSSRIDTAPALPPASTTFGLPRKRPVAQRQEYHCGSQGGTDVGFIALLMRPAVCTENSILSRERIA